MSPLDQDNLQNVNNAVEDFHNARQKAAFETFLGSLTGKPIHLLPYDEVRTKLHAIESASRRLQEIPLDAIVGSVNRYTDFSRTFLPRQASDRDRWARVRRGVESMEGLPPIEVYKVGEAYFVLDGHHRVSVARELGAETIQAYVTLVKTRVPLSPGDRPDDLILKAEYTEFLEKVQIDELRPGANLLLTAPGQYPKLLEHISVHRYFLGQERARQNRSKTEPEEVTEEEATVHWYDTVYEPVANLIRQRNLLRDFPGRTETDLYLWIMEHRMTLGGGFGWELSPLQAADDFSARYSPTIRRRLPRLLHRLQKWLVPSSLESGPPPGNWRREHLDENAILPHRTDHLFDDMLVAIAAPPSQDKDLWPVADFAIQFAHREEARLTGLHLVKNDQQRETPEVQRIREAFAERCAKAGVAGRLLVATGKAGEQINNFSHWTDLVMFRVNYPPPLKPIVRLRSGARLIIRQSAAPILAVPGGVMGSIKNHLERALLAYGGGPKADEALFVSAYLAARWGIALTVLSVQRANIVPSNLLERARGYLEEKGVKAKYVEAGGDAARQVLLMAEDHHADLILMGGYESNPLQESLHPSTVDQVLASTRRPVLICR